MHLTSSKITKHLVLTGLQLNFIDASGRCLDILWQIALITHMSTVTYLPTARNHFLDTKKEQKFRMFIKLEANFPFEQ